MLGLCESCREEVSIMYRSRMASAEDEGVKFEYQEMYAVCTKCNGEVYVGTLHDINIYSYNKAFIIADYEKNVLRTNKTIATDEEVEYGDTDIEAKLKDLVFGAQGNINLFHAIDESRDYKDFCGEQYDCTRCPLSVNVISNEKNFDAKEDCVSAITCSSRYTILKSILHKGYMA